MAWWTVFTNNEVFWSPFSHFHHRIMPVFIAVPTEGPETERIHRSLLMVTIFLKYNFNRILLNDHSVYKIIPWIIIELLSVLGVWRCRVCDLPAGGAVKSSLLRNQSEVWNHEMMKPQRAHRDWRLSQAKNNLFQIWACARGCTNLSSQSDSTSLTVWHAGFLCVLLNWTTLSH